MSQINSSVFPSVFLIAVGVFGLLESDLKGQFIDTIPLYEFADRKSQPITCGKICDLSKDEIKVRDGLEQVHDIQIRSLSSPGQRFVKTTRDALKKYEKQQDGAKKIVDQFPDASKTNQIKLLKKFSAIGQPAGRFHPQIRKLLVESEDDEVVQLAFEIYLKIVPPNLESWDDIFEIIRTSSLIRKTISQKPFEFCIDLSRFGVAAEPFLMNTAFSGVFDSRKNSEKVNIEHFATINGPKNRIRAAAAGGLASMNSGSAMDSVLVVSDAAMKKLNGNIDSATIESILSGLTRSRQSPHSKLSNLRKKLEPIFPKAVKQWVDASKMGIAVNREQARLVRLSKMRNYEGRSGNYLFRGELEKIEDDTGIFINSNLERISIPLSLLSKSSLEWLKTQH